MTRGYSRPDKDDQHHVMRDTDLITELYMNINRTPEDERERERENEPGVCQWAHHGSTLGDSDREGCVCVCVLCV